MQVLEHVERWIQNHDQESYLEIIKHYMPLARVLCVRYIRNVPNKKDDIIATAFLGLVQAVHRAPETMKDTSIEKYIAATINGSIRDFLAYDTTVRIPRSAKIKVEFINEEETESQIDNHDVVDTLQFEDLWKLFDFTSTESKIIKMRIEGYTFKEIAIELELSEIKVKRMLKALKEKSCAS